MIVQYFTAALAIFSGCKSDNSASGEYEAAAPIMELDFNLSRDGDVLFTKTFLTYKDERIELGDGFTIKHQVLPDEAEIYDEICQVIIHLKHEEYKIAAHIPIHTSKLREQIVIDEYTLLFTCKIIDDNN